MMLTRHPLWLPVASHAPTFLERYVSFVQKSPQSRLLLEAINYCPESTKVFLRPCARRVGQNIIALMAFPFTITPAVCDENGESDVNKHTMTTGAFTSLLDTTTSMHITESLKPSIERHVSVNIQVNLLSPISLGERVVLISKLDKLGKRLAYMSATLLRDECEESLAANNEAHEMSTGDMDNVLRRYDVLANGTHVKCIL